MGEFVKISSMVLILSLTCNASAQTKVNSQTKKQQISKEDWQKKQDEIQKSLRYKLNKQRDQMKGLMGQSSFQMYDQILEDMVKRMEKSFNDLDMDTFDQKVLSDINKFFKSGQLKGLTSPINPFGQLGLDDFHKWSETENMRVLELNLTPLKDAPMDIKIEKHLIKVSGKFIIEKKNKSASGNRYSQRMISIDKSFNIPEDCDISKVRFENKNNKILVIFPKKRL